LNLSFGLFEVVPVSLMTKQSKVNAGFESQRLRISQRKIWYKY